MMRFSLSGGELPDCLYVDGIKYDIYTNFHVVLAVLRALGDQNLDSHDRRKIAAGLLFFGKIPSGDWLTPFRDFVGCGQPDGESSDVRDFDYEQDAMELYSAFWQLYGIDLFETKLHWWKFSALLHGAFSTDNALSNKVRLRHIDDTEARRKAATDRAKRNAELWEEVSAAEMAIEEQLRQRLKEGKPIDDLLRR